MSLKDLSALIFAVASAIFLSTVSGAAGSYNSQAVGQQVPSVVSPPSVSGTAEVGESLSADPGDWSGPAATFAYGWQRCDSSGDGCTDVADASSPTYALAAVDVGSTMRVVVTALNKNGSALAVSAPAAVVAPAPAPPPVVSSWAITPSTLPAASVGTAYSQQLAETGPNPPYSFRVGQGSLPAGISLSSAGLVAGTPTSSGSSSFTVTAQDSTGVTAGSQSYTLSVAAAATSGSGCSASTPSACPSSYFTGPLGANELLPRNPGAFLIDWYDGIGTTTAQKQAGVQKRQTDSGRIMDGIGLHPNYGSTSTGCTLRDPPETNYVNWMHANGSFPLLSWTPDKVTIGDVNNGVADTCLKNVADFLKTYPFTIMLRIFTEFDGNWSVWSAMPGTLNGNLNYCGAPMIAAWRRVVNIFKAEGASNVGFFWNPGEGGLNRACAAASYPGDAYVDWVGTEVYNMCTVGDTNCFSTPLHSGWAEWWEGANYTTLATWQCASEPVKAPSCVSNYDKWTSGKGVDSTYYTQKPFAIGESGSYYDPAYPSKKGAWFANIPAALKGQIAGEPQAMPGLVGIEFYDADLTSIGDYNYRVDYPTSNPSAYAGWIKLAQDPYFNTR